jgi:general secretion pathway protein F
MPVFVYKAFSENGDLAEGTLEANSTAALEEALRLRGLTPFSTQETRPERAHGGGPLARSREDLGAKDLALFTREFATLRDADVPLDRSLKLLSKQGSARRRQMSAGLLQDVLNGSSLSDALVRRPATFRADYVNAVRAGESAGRLGPSLVEIADGLERRMEQRARLATALVYPTLLIVLALVSTGIVLGVLVPSITPNFIDSGKALPPGLQLITDIEEHAGMLAIALATFVAGIFFLVKMIERSPSARVAVALHLLKLPLVGATLAKLDAARFARTLATQLRAGVPLVHGLTSAGDVMSNAFLKSEIALATERIRNGETLSSALAAITAMPEALPQMLSIGEEAGRTTKMLDRVAIMYERETQQRIEKIMGMVTPLLTILIAAVVGGLILTVMNAVLSINDLATQ